jgi:2-amino-4-hydroxy-6-hydroxymethyldihydropteridine diphosphokinase
MSTHPLDTFVGYGANVGSPIVTLEQAIPLLERELGAIAARSSFYETLALTLDGKSQSNYINAVLRFSTPLPPARILEVLLEVERQLGRDRSCAPRWAPREIDLDLLFVGSLTEQTKALSLPHPEIAVRDFVLTPMAEIAPAFKHPQLDKTIAELERSLEARGFERFVVRQIAQTTCVNG